MKLLRLFRKQPEANENDTHSSSRGRRSSLNPYTLFTVCWGCGAHRVAKKRHRQRRQRFGPISSAILVVKSTIAIIILHGLVILLWASFYRLQCFPSWELAFYLSSSSYATVGYDDVILPGRWRLLGPLESMAGVLMCGVSVCLLFATITRLLDRDPRHSRKLDHASHPVALGKSPYSSEQSHA